MIDNEFLFDLKDFTFYLSYEKVSFKSLYENNEKTIVNNIEIVEYNSKMYLFSNPHEIIFIFPDNRVSGFYPLQLGVINHIHLCAVFD